jgi:hypothetical protein
MNNEQDNSPDAPSEATRAAPTPVVSTFDAAAIDTKDASNTAIEIEIKHPTEGYGTGMFISVLGKDSDAYRGRVRAMANENLQRESRGMKLDQTLDKLEAKNLDALVAATTAWRTEDRATDEQGHVTVTANRPIIMLRGEALTFTPQNVRKLYADILPIREQVTDAINDLSLFI